MSIELHPCLQIIIYDCERGAKAKTTNSKKYGVDLVHFTSNKSNVVHASTKENDIIRYLNVAQNKYLSYFRGHSKRVVTLCMSPTDESFLSGSLDKTIRLWDLRSANCQGRYLAADFSIDSSFLMPQDVAQCHKNC